MLRLIQGITSNPYPYGTPNMRQHIASLYLTKLKLGLASVSARILWIDPKSWPYKLNLWCYMQILNEQVQLNMNESIWIAASEPLHRQPKFETRII